MSFPTVSHIQTVGAELIAVLNLKLYRVQLRITVKPSRESGLEICPKIVKAIRHIGTCIANLFSQMQTNN